MEPVTHALTSLAFARAGQRRLPRFGMAMLIVAGIAPDLDYLSYFGGGHTFIRFHRTVLHSLAGSALMACVLAGAFCALDRKYPRGAVTEKSFSPLHFREALAVCAIGAGGHLLLDLASGVGVQVLWPFKTHWSAWDLVTNFDLWILLLLAAGLLLPLLFKLVNEEVGEHKRRTGKWGGIVTLLLLAGYLGMKADLHSEAIELLLTREYHGRIPLSAGAFPEGSAPLDWRGVLETDNTLETIDVQVGLNQPFDSNSSITHYKPQDSPALELGQKSSATAQFLEYARFPVAKVQRIEADYRFEVRDLRFEADDNEPANVLLRIDYDSRLQTRRAEFRFASSTGQ
ncbi:MAG TPA: metal-dependent hydrolase [Verrucomicrobiae bacterium]|nr:metal-dependent hydrolase [Verrucomicrobiae bacterium]